MRVVFQCGCLHQAAETCVYISVLFLTASFVQEEEEIFSQGAISVVNFTWQISIIKANVFKLLLHI
jgi:hypothetical protein